MWKGYVPTGNNLLFKNCIAILLRKIEIDQQLGSVAWQFVPAEMCDDYSYEHKAELSHGHARVHLDRFQANESND